MEQIAIIGSGVIGKATGKGLIELGNKVEFFDVNPDIIKKLRQEGYRADYPDKIEMDKLNIFLITINTPTENGKINLEFIKKGVENLGNLLKKKDGFPLVVIRSTISPGTTEEVLIPILEKFSSKKAGDDFGVCYNPEYLREESAVQDFSSPWITVIGAINNRSFEVLKSIYTPYSCPIVELSIKEAEMQKYVHNLFNANKISFFNEMRMVAKKLNIDAQKIFDTTIISSEGIWNKKYGTRDLGPFNGMCLPKDTQAFFTFVKEKLDFEMQLLKSVIDVNKLYAKSLQENNNDPTV